MGSGTVLQSIAECDDVGRTAVSHMWHTFAGLCRHESVASSDKFFRMNTGEPHPFANFVLLSDVNDAELAKDCVAPLLKTPAPSAVIVLSEKKEGPATKAIEALGFSLYEQMPAMAVDIASLTKTELAEGYEFVRATQSDRADWVECLAAGYEIPMGAATAFVPEKLGDDPAGPFQYFAIKHGGKTVAVSMVYMNEGVAGIYCVATLSEHRGKGLGAHATAEPLRIAQRLGYGVGVLQSSEMGHGVYKSLGFRDVGSIPLYVRMP